MSRSGFLPSLLRLLLAVGVVACLVGFAGPGSSGDEHPGGHLATMHAEHAHGAAPVAPEHHGGTDSHAHGCMTAMPGIDGGAAIPEPALAPVAATATAPPSSTGGLAEVPAAPPRPSADRGALCIWRT